MRRPKIRFATEADEAAIMKVAEATQIGEHHIHDGSVADMLLENVLVAELDNRVVAFLFWLHGRRHAYIDSLAVLPEYQNEGVGAWLMHELMFFLDDLNVKHLYACTSPDNGQHVRNMLVRLGYELTGSVMTLRKEIHGGGIYG